MNTRAKAFFSLILVFLVGLLIGGSVTHLYLYKFSRPPTSDSRYRRPSDRQFPVQEMLDKLTLNSDQEKQLHSILERRREDMHKAAQDAREAYSEVKQRTRAEILEVLTEDQAQQFDEFMQELRSRRRHRKAQPPTETPSESEQRE